ncbi:MAG TPA: hypothetical protein VK431_00325 [Nitrosopumilaceae archaeon]|nr:hypothetical protein [Nitrosopumilaceae archaeon]
MSEKNTSINKFEKAYIASITNVRSGGLNLAKDESEFVEIPPPVKEMIDEIMKAKFNSDMEKLRQEIKESKVQHEFVEELRKEIRNLHEKLGNVEQEKIILNSLVSKVRDIDENVMVCQKTVDKITQEIKESKVQHEFIEELRKEIRNLHEKLGNVEQENKTRIEKEKNQEMEQIKNLQNIARQESDMLNESKKMKPKNENISLVLSVVLGLFGLSGISHIYLDKMQKGAGILIVSFILIGVTGYFMYVTASQNMLNLLSILHSFWIIPLVGYYGFFAWQIFDARRLCLKYNKYVSESGKLPPWW